MSSREMIREMLRIVSSRVEWPLDEFVQRLLKQSQELGHDLTALALDGVKTLARWNLVEVRREGVRQRFDEVQGISRHELKSFELRISPAAVEMENILGFRLESGPIFGIPSKRPERQPDVFVVIPFAVEMEPVFARIQAVGESLSLKVARGDHLFTANAVMEDVWSALYFARLVVADCTGQNPNVFYEIGLAHAIGKKTILISQAMDGIPFNVNYLRVIAYAATEEGVEELRVKLERTMRELLDE
jgi:hypothetical protein